MSTERYRELLSELDRVWFALSAKEREQLDERPDARALADLAHRVASEARRNARLAFDAAWARFTKCELCGAPYYYLDFERYRCVCGGALTTAGYTPAPEGR